MRKGEGNLIYLDHNATSPLLPEVLDAMKPWFGVPANPASAHRCGQAATIAVDEARYHVARLINGDPTGVVFTSGATEGNHLFIRGMKDRLQTQGQSYAVSGIEHPCVLAAADILERCGVHRKTLQASRSGQIILPGTPDETIGLMSIMAANHETGVIQPYDEAIDWCVRAGAALHIDATQAAGRIALDLSRATGVVLSAHKMGGPGGVGALVLQDGEPYPALMGGGAQERGRRAGTVNTAGVVGFGKACEIAYIMVEKRASMWQTLRDFGCDKLVRLGATITGESAVQNTIHAVFPNHLGESIVQAMDLRGVCISAGAACSSGSVEVSPVLQAMGIEHAKGAIRISMGPETTKENIAECIAKLKETLEALESMWEF